MPKTLPQSTLGGKNFKIVEFWRNTFFSIWITIREEYLQFQSKVVKPFNYFTRVLKCFILSFIVEKPYFFIDCELQNQRILTKKFCYSPREEMEFACLLCHRFQKDRRFEDEEKILVHIFKHLNIYSLQCSSCLRGFRVGSEFAQHQQICSDQV